MDSTDTNVTDSGTRRQAKGKIKAFFGRTYVGQTDKQTFPPLKALHGSPQLFDPVHEITNTSKYTCVLQLSFIIRDIITQPAGMHRRAHDMSERIHIDVGKVGAWPKLMISAVAWP